MKPFVENSLKQFVQSCVEIFGHQSQFVAFERSQPSAGVQGFQSDSIFGSIRYRNEQGLQLSPPLLLKLAPTKSPPFEALFFQYGNEIFFYCHLLPFFAHLEPSIWQLVPKCYASFTQTYAESTEAAIFLQDLGGAYYKNAPKLTFLDYAHLSLMAKSLGKFHGLSYLAKQQDLVTFNAYALSLNPVHVHIIGKTGDGMAKVGARGLAGLANSEYETFIPVIQDLLDKADRIVVNMFKNERYNPWAVVCHGDYLPPNVMFKYDQGKPVDMKMVDFAMSTYSSPVLDLALVLYMNADQETRDLYWDRLLDDYCQGLSSLPVPVNLPSREDIVNEFKAKAFYAYLIAYFLPFILSIDLELGDYHQLLSPMYSGQSVVDLPDQVRNYLFVKVGGEVATKVLVDILKDMLKRGFISNSIFSEI